MNLYLATCHTLSLLEEGIQPLKFRDEVLEVNPLFASACISPQKFLLLLTEEKLIQQQKGLLKLTSLGKLLYQHVLNWSARDHEQVTKNKEAFQIKTGEGPLDLDCPRCGSKFCALHVFVVLLERLFAGLEHWNNWEAYEKMVLASALNQVLYDAEAEQGNQLKLYVLGETIGIQDLLPTEQKTLKMHIQILSERLKAKELEQDFQKKSQQPTLIYDLPGLKLPSERVPRLKLAYRLYSEEAWQKMHFLAYPELKHFIGTGELPPPGDQLEQGLFVRLSRVAFNQERDQAVLFMKAGELGQVLHLRGTGNQWRLHRLELLTL